MQPRADLMRRLRAGEGDNRVLIVGGGVNGLGVFRDLTLQGVAPLLVERGDFASGTSAAPSRLIHGGLRYLETGEFALVRESVVERNHLLVNAAHLVKPQPVWIPTFSWTGGAFSAALRFLKLKRTPGAKGALVVKLGLAFFDRFGKANRVMPRHRLVSIANARARLPNLHARVSAVAEYYDAKVTSPERLALEIAGDAERDVPDAMAIPYLSVAGIENNVVTLRDEIDGTHATVRPRLVVNCAGPWVDRVDGSLEIERKLMGGTKGSHLVLERADIAERLGDLMLYFETHDHRACLIYRLEGPRVLLGTTDIRTDDPADMTCSQAEIDYLFRVLDEVLPGSAAKRSDIVFAYAGVRPLPRSQSGATGAISRDHAITTFEPDERRPFPVIALVGGKWTTYRACSEQIADLVLARLGTERRATTLGVAIGGGRDFPADAAGQERFARDIAGRHGARLADAVRLVGRYGTTADTILASAAADGFLPLASAPLYFRAEIRWIVANERVTRLSDVILRRTLIAFENGANAGSVREIAELVRDGLGWSRERMEAEMAETLAVLKNRHLVPGLAGGETKVSVAAAAE